MSTGKSISFKNSKESSDLLKKQKREIHENTYKRPSKVDKYVYIAKKALEEYPKIIYGILFLLLIILLGVYQFFYLIYSFITLFI